LFTIFASHQIFSLRWFSSLRYHFDWFHY
jgi:hypothetical protein